MIANSGISCLFTVFNFAYCNTLKNLHMVSDDKMRIYSYHSHFLIPGESANILKIGVQKVLKDGGIEGTSVLRNHEGSFLIFAHHLSIQAILHLFQMYYFWTPSLF